MRRNIGSVARRGLGDGDEDLVELSALAKLRAPVFGDVGGDDLAGQRERDEDCRLAGFARLPLAEGAAEAVCRRRRVFRSALNGCFMPCLVCLPHVKQAGGERQLVVLQQALVDELLLDDLAKLDTAPMRLR